MKEMFNQNVNLVYKVFHDKIEKNLDNPSMRDDLIQIGLLSLWKCCANYDPSKGVLFSTYAYNSIKNSMSCAMYRERKKTALLVSLSKSVQEGDEEGSITYEDVIASPVNIASELEIDDLVEEISAELGNNAAKIVDMVRKGHTQVSIAKELNMTRSTVHAILNKFREKLKNTLFLDE